MTLFKKLILGTVAAVGLTAAMPAQAHWYRPYGCGYGYGPRIVYYSGGYCAEPYYYSRPAYYGDYYGGPYYGPSYGVSFAFGGHRGWGGYHDGDGYRHEGYGGRWHRR